MMKVTRLDNGNAGLDVGFLELIFWMMGRTVRWMGRDVVLRPRERPKALGVRMGAANGVLGSFVKGGAVELMR